MNLIETAEYSKLRGIDEEPSAFAWGVNHTLKKRDWIISAINSKTRKKSHKYGIELPRSVEHAYQLNKQNGDGNAKRHGSI